MKIKMILSAIGKGGMMALLMAVVDTGKAGIMAASNIKMRQVLYKVLAPTKQLANSTISPLFYLGLLSCVLLASCAMPLRTAREFHEAAPMAAYQGFADFPFEKLSLKDNRLFLIDEHSPAFNFATGKSFFRAFALPQSSTPYTVTLRSYLVGPTLKNGYIFAPRAIFLDDSFTVTRTLGTDYFHYANPGFFENMGGKGLSWRAMLEGSTRIDRSARDEHYLIILTTKKALEEKTIMPEPVYAMDWDWLGTPWALRRTGEVKIPVSNSPVGNLRIILE